ncbi:MAG: tripartite tricarboxylate transporter TctB family protein [Desulfobacterales bacterium]|nr:MAG: tripartite tricarboxylate transporter TctB family protein [Desulfobacterales bacterium]
MKGKGMPKADFVMGLILMAFGLFAILESIKIPTFEKDWGGFYAAPGFVPLILGITIFGMSLALFIRATRRQGYKIIPARDDIRNFVRSKPVHRWCLAMFYAFGFFFLLGHIYFYLAAFLVLFAFMNTFSEQKLWQVLSISLAAAGLVYLVFTKIFLVPLP